MNYYKVFGIARDVNANENLFVLDVSDTNKLEQIIKENSFDIVINCIGLLNKTAESSPELAVWYNSYFPHLLSSLGSKYDFKLIHISTDCVFSGKEGGYREDSFKNGVGFYAQSKALGEVINTNDLTFRTSIIGPELKQNGIGLFHWFMNQEKKISGFSKAYWTGVTTLELAEGINQAIRIGVEFKNKGIPISRVLTSQWCRCKDTAFYAFNDYIEFPDLNSTYSSKFKKNQSDQISSLINYINNTDLKNNNVIFVTHYVIIGALTDYYPDSAEIVITDQNLNVISTIKSVF